MWEARIWVSRILEKAGAAFSEMAFLKFPQPKYRTTILNKREQLTWLRLICWKN
jgi:hypothetical protein